MPVLRSALHLSVEGGRHVDAVHVRRPWSRRLAQPSPDGKGWPARRTPVGRTCPIAGRPGAVAAWPPIAESRLGHVLGDRTRGWPWPSTRRCGQVEGCWW